MKLAVFLSAVLAAIGAARGETPVRALIEGLASTNLAVAARAHAALASRGAGAIPPLLEMARRHEPVPLTDDHDLKALPANLMPLDFKCDRADSGCGDEALYDLHWLDVRAGWTLEWIAFRSFGFSLVEMPRTPYAGERSYRVCPYAKPAYRKEAAARGKALARAAANARAWWAAQKKPWRRLDALVEALNDASPARQGWAVVWLSYAPDRIDGLTRAVWERDMAARVRALERSKDEDVSLGARILLEKPARVWRQRPGDWVRPPED